MIRETNSRAWCISLYLGKVQNSTGNYVFRRFKRAVLLQKQSPSLLLRDRMHWVCLFNKLVLINRGQGRGSRSWKTRGSDSLISGSAVFLSLLTWKPEVCSSSSQLWLLLPVRQEITSFAKITSCGKTPRPHRKEPVFPRRLCF